MREVLLHFSETIARSILTPLVHKHSKVRIMGLKALHIILFCSVYKYSTNIFEFLTGFRDPNVVPIKAFYEGL